MTSAPFHMLDRKDAEATLAALRRRRAEVRGWLDGPVREATLSAIDRMIAELEREIEASAA
jgi:hypothetical protein